MFSYRFTFQSNTTIFLVYFVTLRLGTAIPSSSERMKSVICWNTHVTGARGGVVVKATNRQVAGSIPDGVIGIFQ